MAEQAKSCLDKIRRGNLKVAVRAITAARSGRNEKGKGIEPGKRMCVETVKVCHNPKGRI